MLAPGTACLCTSATSGITLSSCRRCPPACHRCCAACGLGTFPTLPSAHPPAPLTASMCALAPCMGSWGLPGSRGAPRALASLKKMRPSVLMVVSSAKLISASTCSTSRGELTLHASKGGSGGQASQGLECWLEGELRLVQAGAVRLV